jgi:hypothetical protein
MLDTAITEDVQPCSTMPFFEDEDFVGRENILEEMENRLSRGSVHSRLALVGPGGVGLVKSLLLSRSSMETSN